MADKLYLITRQDLPPGQQAVQAAHAMRQFQHEHREIEKRWFESSNTLALLEVADEQALAHLLLKARRRDIHASGFREPDRGDELTAVALGPAGKSLCQKLELALQGVSTRGSRTPQEIPEPR